VLGCKKLVSNFSGAPSFAFTKKPSMKQKRGEERKGNNTHPSLTPLLPEKTANGQKA
jgi:hypothetical protein